MRTGLSALSPLSEVAIRQIDKWMPECYSVEFIMGRVDICILGRP
jgi:hypothetical protein